MALHLTHKINQRAHIIGRGQSLDLIVRSVQGSYDCCEVELEVRSQTESKILRMKTNEPRISVLEGLEIALMGKNSRNSVKIAYTASWDYQIRRKDY